ncbi:MAG: FGGY-family carbohydrate kinase [Chromatiaceae bacterium]|nr:FGGY-family carbohydrate kinase [Chromatiaceae bacterium]
MSSARATPDCYIGLDLGTSGCRAVAIDDDGRVAAEARQALPESRHPQPGASEQDPDDWWNATIAVLKLLVEQRPGLIRAICVDGTSSTLLLCDRQGGPCTAGLMYDDRRAGAQATLIERVAPPESAARGAGSALAKLLYLLEIHQRMPVAHAVHQADWINGRLGGRFGISDENNALKLGYDPVARQWPDWLGRLPFPSSLLPRVLPVGAPLGTLSRALTTLLGLAEDVLLVAGTTDSNAATLAAGIDRIGDAVTSLGSTLVVKILSDRPVSSSRYGVYSHRIGDQWLVGGASNTGGSVLRQFFSDIELAELSPQIDPERTLGLGYYPLPAAGERFPNNDPQMLPRMQPRPADKAEFLQAIFEGIAAIEAEGYARLAELGAPSPGRIYTCGGGAVNETWRRIREHRLGVPVQRAEHTEAAYGVALLARAAVRGSAAQLGQ